VSFDWPWLLPAVPAAALIVAVLAWLGRRRRIRSAAAWSDQLAKAARRGRMVPVALAVAAALAVVGIAGPRWGSADVDTETRALNLVIAIDISRSMLAEDAAPSRLARAVRESRRLVQDVRGDRVALLAFAGRSYILTPLTLDDGAVSLQLDALDPEVASEGGTELAAVLRQGRELLTAASEGGARAMVIFTDGEAHDSVPAVLEAARGLRDAGATVIVVGSGGVRPARIPLRNEDGALVEFKKDASGADVFTQRRDEVLRAVADAAEGILVPGDFPDQAGAVWKTLATLDRDPARGRRTEDLVPRAWLFALAAFAVLWVQAIRRNGPVLGGLLLALIVDRGEAQRPVPGGQRLAARDTTKAITAYLGAAKAQGGGGGDTSWYNGGSLALARGQFELAGEALGSAANSLDPTVRFQALYNLGLAALLESRRDTTRRTALEEEAARRLREALLLDPGSAAAKWNLELVSRRRPPPPPTSGGTQRDRRPPPPAPSPSGGLSPTEADQILRSVERTEQTVRNEQLRRRRIAASAAGKDW
jgi:Ca-activated chloride channel family protein